MRATRVPPPDPAGGGNFPSTCVSWLPFQHNTQNLKEVFQGVVCRGCKIESADEWHFARSFLYTILLHGYVNTFHKPKYKLIRYEKLLCLGYPFGDVGAIDTEWQRSDKFYTWRLLHVSWSVCTLFSMKTDLFSLKSQKNPAGTWTHLFVGLLPSCFYNSFRWM